MRSDEGRTIGLYFKVSPEEETLILQKMKQAGIRNKRAYLRKMALEGYIVHLDMGNMMELIRLFRSAAGNVNQIARRCNETGNLYAEDVEDIRKGYAEIQKQLADAVGRLAKL